MHLVAHIKHLTLDFIFLSFITSIFCPPRVSLLSHFDYTDNV